MQDGTKDNQRSSLRIGETWSDYQYRGKLLPYKKRKIAISRCRSIRSKRHCNRESAYCCSFNPRHYCTTFYTSELSSPRSLFLFGKMRSKNRWYRHEHYHHPWNERDKYCGRISQQRRPDRIYDVYSGSNCDKLYSFNSQMSYRFLIIGNFKT